MGIKNESISRYIHKILIQKFYQVNIRNIIINFDTKTGQFAWFLAVKYLFQFNEILLYLPEHTLLHNKFTSSLQYKFAQTRDFNYRI